MAATTDTAPLSILCFGDSLTQGFHYLGLGQHPYATTLAARLRAALPGRAVTVRADGRPGDVASEEPWRLRLREACTSTSRRLAFVLACFLVSVVSASPSCGPHLTLRALRR